MKNEDISKLVDEFVRRIKLYKTEYGQDEFWNLGLNLYTNELKDWHSAQHFPEESKITKERLTIIMNVLLDAISYMSKKNIKESMKKSELKALIREVIEETTDSLEATPLTDAELGDGSDLSSVADAVEFAKKLERMLNAEKQLVKKLQAELREKSGFTNNW